MTAADVPPPNTVAVEPRATAETGSPPPIVIVAGPTASGKSRLALDLAATFRGTVINADSMQVYRELRVLTARPSAEDEARVPHRLYGVLSARCRCSAGRWRELASGAIEEAWRADRLPVIVGGTGLYLRALRQGLAPVPRVPAEVRAEAQAKRAALGAQRFHATVAVLDPDTARRVPPGDAQRLIRAYEVAIATGRPLSAWQREATAAGLRARAATVVLMPPRDTLYAGIDARFIRMIDAGAVDEVRKLVALDLDPSLPAAKAVGVAELTAYLRGEATLASACADGQRATRNYAKRQMTWIRHQIAADFALGEQYSERFLAKICTFIRQFLLTAAS